MKFLDLISRKREADDAAHAAGHEPDPAPLHEVLAEASAARRDDEGGADILDYPGEEPGAGAEDAPRSFLDDDGSYDWDLSDLDADAADSVPVAEARTPAPADEQQAEMLEGDDAADDEAEAGWDDAWDEPPAGDTAEQTADDDAEDPEPLTLADPIADPADDAEPAPAPSAPTLADAVAEAEAADTAHPDDASEFEDETDMVDNGSAIASITAALRAEMPHEPAAKVDDRAPAASTQQALLATIRAAREKAERARLASESGEAAHQETVAEDSGFGSPEERFEDETPEHVMTAEDDAFTAAETQEADFSDDLSEDEAETVMEDDADSDEDDAFEAEDGFDADDEFGSAGDEDFDADEGDFEDVAETAGEEDEAPAATAPGRKIWELEVEDDAPADTTEDDADHDWDREEDDAALAADEPATAPRPAASTPADAAAVSAMGAPKRRAGRVKTRLLGFNKPAQSDPISQAMETPVADSPTFPVGWIVVVKGPGRGASFALGAGASKIGRGEDQAVRLDFGDNSISRDNHAVVAYDDEQRRFYLGHGGKANLVRLNDMPVLSTETIGDGDLIRIGETTLRFVALCGPEFTWAEDEAGSFPHAAAE